MEEEKKAREEDDNVDAMKALENRTLDSKVEMDILDALDEIRAINHRHERIDTDEVLEKLQFKKTPKMSNELTEEDEELIHSIKFKSNQVSDKINQEGAGDALISAIESEIQAKKESSAVASTLPIIIKKKRKIESEVPPVQPVKVVPSSGLFSLYDNSDEDNSS